MALKIFFFCILFAHTSASFFDEFRGAMSSVENSFGKLMSDVVSDVRDTIGCTILAVKQVLALGGIFHESSEYNARCRGISEPPKYVQETNYNHAPTPPMVITTTTVYISSTEAVTDTTEKSFTEKMSHEIDDSVKNINRTMFDLVDKSHTKEKMENVSSALQSESNRLSKLGDLLHRELSNISEDVKKELRKLDSDTNNPTIDEIWNKIRALHNIELNHTNTPEAIKVHRILNEVLSILRGYNYEDTAAIGSIEIVNKKSSDNTFDQIKNQFKKMEAEEAQDLNIVEDIVETDLNSRNDDNKFKSSDIPVTFKDVAKKIMDETSRTLRLEDPQENAFVSSSTESTFTTETADYDDDEYEDEVIESPEYAAIFPPKNSHSREEAVKETHLLIEKSKENDAILNSYFENSSNLGASVFDNPDLFNFGK